MRGKVQEATARLAGRTRLPLVTFLVVLAVAAPVAARQPGAAAAKSAALPAFNPATATAAEALAYFQRVGPGAGRHLEVKRGRLPDGSLGILAVSNCWGPGSYGYIVDYALDSHHNTRAKICVEWATSPRSVRTRQRMSCFKDSTLVVRCRWAFRSELWSYHTFGGVLRKVTNHTLPGGVWKDTWVTQGAVYTPANPCGVTWETWIRNTNGNTSWLVRYRPWPDLLAFIPQQSSLRGQVCLP
jgi:hypothetical protein